MKKIVSRVRVFLIAMVLGLFTVKVKNLLNGLLLPGMISGLNLALYMPSGRMPIIPCGWVQVAMALYI